MVKNLNKKLKINRILILQNLIILTQFIIISNQIPDINNTIILPLKKLEILTSNLIKENSSDILGLIIKKYFLIIYT